MLDPDQKHSVTFRRITALLLFISCITIQRIALAEDLTAQTAEEYRALGYVQQQQGNLSEALAYYTKATSLGPSQ
jgi:tetratricopeptide (TPR) repeat protein